MPHRARARRPRRRAALPGPHDGVPLQALHRRDHRALPRGPQGGAGDLGAACGGPGRGRPALGYSEVDGSPGGEWVRVAPRGVVTAVARVHRPIAGLHPVERPFAFVLVKLDGADTALAHVVTDDLDALRVGARVEAVWKPDGERVGSIRDIACFRVVEG